MQFVSQVLCLWAFLLVALFPLASLAADECVPDGYGQCLCTDQNGDSYTGLCPVMEPAKSTGGISAKGATSDPASGSISDPVSGPTSGPLPSGQPPAETAAAKAKAEAEALAREIEERNKRLAEELAKKAAAAQGSQAVMHKAGKENNELGRAHAANVAALWCANGANSQQANPEVAVESYGKCQKNYDAAKGIPSSVSGYNRDSELLQGRAAQKTMDDFGKNFGVSSEDYMSRMLGEDSGPYALSDMIKGKISEEDFAAAMAAGGGDDKFAASTGGGKAKPEKSLRDSLKKALAKEGKLLERVPTSLAEKSYEPTKIVGLKAESGLFAPEEKLSEEELTIFAVVHRKYKEMVQARGL